MDEFRPALLILSIFLATTYIFEVAHSAKSQDINKNIQNFQARFNCWIMDIVAWETARKTVWGPTDSQQSEVFFLIL